MASSLRSDSAFQSVVCRTDPSSAGFSTSSCISFLFLQWRQIPLSLPLPMLPAPPSPARPLLQEVHCPGSPTSSRRWPPRPLPVRLVRRPAGTRLPIPYMDKCVQAKSGIQAPDVSLQRSGHRTGDRGEGVGRKEGESTNQQPLPACCRSFTFCLWVRSRGPLELSRDK